MRYKQIYNKIEELKRSVDNFSIGHSLLGEEITGFHVGSYLGKQLLLTAGIHAREYISTLFLLKEIPFLAKKKVNAYIVPLLNPDGVRLVMDGTRFVRDRKLRRFLIDINGSRNFDRWKANLNGVDLNVNFDADWGGGKCNQRKLARENFVGHFPCSEIENINIVNFLKHTKISGSLAFHSKGEVMYYGFKMKGARLKKEQRLGLTLAKINGYELVKTKHSSGGLTDYIVSKYDVPSFTVELGAEELSHPIGEKFLPEIYELNKNLPTEFFKLLEIFD